MSLRKFRVLIIASPRSGSSYLRSNVNGTDPVFGELLLKTSRDPLSLELLNIPPSLLWDFLSSCDRTPSAIPGQPSMAGKRPGHIVGVKVMGAEFIGKNFKRAFHLLLGADLVVFIRPDSFFRQVRSLYKIRTGGSAHYYLMRGKDPLWLSKSSQEISFGAYLKSVLVILANRTLCMVLNAIAFGFRKQRLLAHQRNLGSAQRSVYDLTETFFLPSDGER